MKQLPGIQSRKLPLWLKTILAGTIIAIATIWLLPFLLLFALVLSIMIIPMTRRLRRDVEKVGFSVNESWRTDQRRDINITPWHRKVCNAWGEFSSGKAR